MIVNCDQIAWVEFNPDTVISLTNGEKLIVCESPETIVDLVRIEAGGDLPPGYRGISW